jgi:ribosomal protein S18 acetylase RimI-like enzyme
VNATRFVIAPLGQRDRSGFCCGVEALDRYFHQQIGQDIRRGITTCFVAEERETSRIAGYYTLSAAEVLVADLPPEITRRLPRYPTIPAARIGRLAVDQDFRGCKLGSALIVSAASRAAASNLAVFAMVVDAKDDAAAAFYQHHGFAHYGASKRCLFAPLQSLVSARDP